MSQETLNTILVSVIVPLLIALTGYIVKWINKKTDEINNKIKNDNLVKYLEIAEDAICKSVTMVSQTFVDALKKEGMFTIEDAKLAFNQAKYKTLAILSDKAKEALTEAFGDLDVWLQAQIEYYVRTNKLELIEPEIK